MKKVREGYKMTELGEIPNQWEIKNMESLFNFYGGLSLARDKQSDKGVYYLHYGDIHKKNKNYFSVSEDGDWLPRVETECNTVKEGAWLYTGDIVFADASEDYEGIGKSVVIINENNEKFVSGLHTIIAKDKGNGLDNQYKKYCFSTTHVRKQFRALANGATVYGISKSNIKDIKILVPSLKEQKQMALILSSVDEQIENTDNLIEKTRELKKGLMQRLLTKGIGHKEFKKTEVGVIPRDWEVKTLCDISKCKGEYGIGAVATEYISGDPRYLRITDIGEDSRLLFNDIKGISDKEYEKYLLKENDIVFARTGNTTGKSYVYNPKEGELVYAGFLIKFVIQSKRYWDWINVMSTRSGQPGINSSEYSQFLVQLPDIEEQNRIASILLSVDEKIQLNESKKEKLQELKKGLMQKLLTGKIRVRI